MQPVSRVQMATEDMSTADRIGVMDKPERPQVQMRVLDHIQVETLGVTVMIANHDLRGQ